MGIFYLSVYSFVWRGFQPKILLSPINGHTNYSCFHPSVANELSDITPT
jgi:hypothetical protein